MMRVTSGARAIEMPRSPQFHRCLTNVLGCTMSSSDRTNQKQEQTMIRRTITLPELGLIAGTRAMAGVGIGLLLADRLNPERRRAIGWTLLAVGALTTIPLAAEVFLSHEEPATAPENQRAGLMAAH